MGLITGYRDVTARVHYFITAEVEGINFINANIPRAEITEPSVALTVSKKLSEKGFNPRIERLIAYIDCGHHEEAPTHDNITIAELEKIVSKNQVLTKRFPVVESNY